MALVFELKMSQLLGGEENKRPMMPAFVFLLPTCIRSLLVLWVNAFFFFLNCAPLLIEGRNEKMPQFFKWLYFKSSCFLKQLLKWKDVVWWWHWLSEAHYLHFFMLCSIRWTLLAIFIITGLLCVEPPKGLWQLIAAERRYVHKWLDNG